MRKTSEIRRMSLGRIFRKRKRGDLRRRRRLSFEPLECRRVLAAEALHNVVNPGDVDGDGQVLPIDVLHVVAALRLAHASSDAPVGESARPLYLDVDNDKRITPIDVLWIVHNALGEGEHLGQLNEDLEITAPFAVILTDLNTPRNVTGIQVDDPEAMVESGNVVTIEVINTAMDPAGTITLDSTDNVNLIEGDGTDDERVQFIGQFDAVNTVLNQLTIVASELPAILRLESIDPVDPTREAFRDFPLLPTTGEITAVPDFASAIEDGPTVFIDVLANDSINSGTGPTISAPGDPSVEGGTVAPFGNGLNYTPPPNFSGTDTFTYTITNGSSFASADVTVTVDPFGTPQITGPTSLILDEDDPGVSLSGFTIRDLDSNNINVTLGAGGFLSQTFFSGTPSEVTNALNSVTYTPLSDSTAPDTIQIIADDGGLSSQHSVTITINPINDPPINTVPGPQVVFNTRTLQFTNNEFQVADVDASMLEVTLEIEKGILGIDGGGVQVQGNNSSSLTATGTISNLNLALNTLFYDPADFTFTGIPRCGPGGGIVRARSRCSSRGCCAAGSGRSVQDRA